jgi:hypothetical protein
MKKKLPKAKNRTLKGKQSANPPEDDFLAPVPVRKSFHDYSGFSMKGIPSIALISNLAVKIGKVNGSWLGSVESALDLLNTISEEVNLLESEQKSPIRLDPPDNAHFPFVKGMKLITGQKRKDRATEAFQDLLHEIIMDEGWEVAQHEERANYPDEGDYAFARRYLAKQITEFEQKGFSGQEVRAYRLALKETKKPKGVPHVPLWVIMGDN